MVPPILDLLPLDPTRIDADPQHPDGRLLSKVGPRAQDVSAHPSPPVAAARPSREGGGGTRVTPQVEVADHRINRSGGLEQDDIDIGAKGYEEHPVQEQL